MQLKIESMEKTRVYLDNEQQIPNVLLIFRKTICQISYLTLNISKYVFFPE